MRPHALCVICMCREGWPSFFQTEKHRSVQAYVTELTPGKPLANFILFLTFHFNDIVWEKRVLGLMLQYQLGPLCHYCFTIWRCLLGALNQHALKLLCIMKPLEVLSLSRLSDRHGTLEHPPHTHIFLSVGIVGANFFSISFLLSQPCPLYACICLVCRGRWDSSLSPNLSFILDLYSVETSATP